MPRLVIHSPGSGEVEWELTSGEYVLGRALDCDIVLGGSGVSRSHCRLVFLDQEWHVEDLDSRNGIFLNDTKIERSVLRHGDRLRIGERREMRRMRMIHRHDVRETPLSRIASVIGRDDDAARRFDAEGRMADKGDLNFVIAKRRLVQ